VIKPSKTAINALFGLCGLLLILPSEVWAQTTWTVDRLSDSGEGAGSMGDLRYCVTNATDGDRIVVAVEGIIELTGGLPDLTRSISIEGPGATLLTVRQATEYGIWYIFHVWNATVAISGLTVANADYYGIANRGNLVLKNSTVFSNGHWGRYGTGIWNGSGGTMVVSHSIVSENAAGGGIQNRGTLTIDHTTIAGNISYDWEGDSGLGGGIINTGRLTITHSTIAGNSAFGGASIAFGGGIWNNGTVNITDSTIFGNYAGGGAISSGGGIDNDGTLSVSNSTISGNAAYGAEVNEGGGIHNQGTLTISNSTIAGNTADYGGGVFNTATMTAHNSILADNAAAAGAPDLAGSLGSLGDNVIGNSTGGSGYHQTDLLNVDPLLGPLQDNGGPTFTYGLLQGSPAIDRGDNANAPTWDQRGDEFVRIVNGAIDIGSFEVQAADTANTVVTLRDLTQTYTGSPLTPTANTIPPGLPIVWTNAPQTSAGTYLVTATVNDPDHQGVASGTFIIVKATATVTLSNLTQTYTGSPLTPTATANPAGLPIVWTNAPQTDAGSYAVTAAVNDPNYEGAADGTLVIGKVTATVTLSNLSQSYTGSPLMPTAATSPPNLAMVWTNAPQTNAGSYAVAATINDLNYQGTTSGSFDVQKATATVELNNLTQTYTGSPLMPTAATSPPNLAMVWTNAPQTNTGSYAVAATVNDVNYQGTTGGTFDIQKATATVELNNLTQTYTGSPLMPTAATRPPNLPIVWTNAPQTNANSYTVVAAVNDANYQGTATGTFTIKPRMSAPTNLNAVSAKGKVKLSWTQSTSAGVTHNRVYRSITSGGPSAMIATIGANTSYTDSQVTGGVTYYYVVTAVRGNEESAPSNQDVAKPK
jgi:hypothetical protein